MGVKHMQGVPAHIEFLHDTKHERRNMLWCKNLINQRKYVIYLIAHILE